MNPVPAPQASPPPAPAPGHRRTPSKQRMTLRNATYIVPATGQRSRLQISLRTSSNYGRPANAASSESVAFGRGRPLRDWYLALKQYILKQATAAWTFANSDTGRDTFKCSLAYLLASMGTFWPPLSEFLGNRDGKHVVATLTVYFHPARTVGSMLEAILMGIVAILYAEVVCLLSMAVPVMFRSKWEDIFTIAHIIVLVVFVGGGLGFIGWVKHRLNSPLSNVASTLASIAIITIVTKEDAVHWGRFSFEKMTQVFKMLIVGMSITAAVNFLVWRKSACDILRSSTITASTALGDMLSAITQGFLHGSEETESDTVSRVSARYAASQARMGKCLREVKYEEYFFGHEEIYRLESTMAKALESVAQAVGGLRSACETQFALMKETAPSEAGAAIVSPDPIISPNYSMSPLVSPTMVRPKSKGTKGRPRSLASIDESTERRFRRENCSTPGDGEIVNAPIFRTPSDILELFIRLLGPSMKSLAWTLSEILRESAFEQGPDGHYNVSMKEQFRESLHEALSIYNISRGNALHNLYRSIEFGRTRSAKIEADIEEVAAACGHFSFSLIEVAKQMDKFLDILDELKARSMSKKRTWKYLRIWEKIPFFKRRKNMDRGNELDNNAQDHEIEGLLQKPVQRMRKSALPKGIPDTMVKRRDNIGWEASPGSDSMVKFLSQKAMGVLRFLARDDIRFAIKVAIGATCWAALAFAPGTRPIYMSWRGEWGLLSYMIVVSMTMGAANTTGMARFIGTMVGAAFAITGWIIGNGNAVALAFIGWLVSLVNFYFILVVGNAPLGRIALLCYNVTVLYAYSLSKRVDDDDDDEGGESPAIVDICFHRAVAVTLGILWGIIVCRIIWPISGRHQVREGLSVLYLQLGLIWRRGPLSMMAGDDTVRPYMRTGEQAALQRYASKINDLRVAAESEFSLRGPFPTESYARIMKSTAYILDSLYTMKLLADRRVHLTKGERALLEFTRPEREQLCRRLCHVFQVLASSIMLEYPLTDAVPSIVHVKDRLLGRIHSFRMDRAAVLDTVHSPAVFWGGIDLESRPLTSYTQDPLSPKDTMMRPLSRGIDASLYSPVSRAPSRGRDLSVDMSVDEVLLQDSMHDVRFPSQEAEALIVEEQDYALLYAYTLVTAQIAKELMVVQKEVEGLFGVLQEDSMLLQ